MDKNEKPISVEEYKKDQEKYLYNLGTFAYGAVAGNLVAQKNLPGANASLEKLALDMGIVDDSNLEGFVKGTFASDKGIQTASSIYADKYETARGRLTVSNLWGFYNNYATKYLGDLKPKADEEMAKFKDVDYGAIRDKYLSAQEIAKSKTKNFTKEQKEKAMEDVKKYEKVIATLETLNKAYLRPYATSVDEILDIKSLRSLYSDED